MSAQALHWLRSKPMTHLAVRGNSAAAHASPLLHTAPNWQAQLPTGGSRTGTYAEEHVHRAYSSAKVLCKTLLLLC